MCKVTVVCCCRGGSNLGLVAAVVVAGVLVGPAVFAALTAFLAWLVWWTAVVAGTAAGAAVLCWGGARALEARADRRDARMLEASRAPQQRIQATITDVRVVPTSKDRIRRTG